MKKQFIIEAQRLQKLAGITEVKVKPQKQPEEETPEGWEEEKGDIGEEDRNGNLIVREYYRDDIYLDEYHTVDILKRPNGEYYVAIKTSDQYKYQSNPFDSFVKAKEYAFNEMDIIIDRENEGYYYDEDPDAAYYDQHDDD